MRGDPQVADPGVVGQHDGERRWRTAGPALLIEHVGDGGRADGPAREGLGERGIERGRAEAVEQIEQAARFGGERMAPRGERLEEGVGVGAAAAEQIAPAQLVRGALHGGERGEVRGVLDDLAVIVGAGMARELGGAVDDRGPCVRRRRG